MLRACIAVALLSLLAPLPTRADPPPLLVFIAPADGEPSVGGRLALERLKSGLEASLAPAPTSALGLTRAAPVPTPAAALAQAADGQDAWLRTSFDEAEQALRAALGWALGHLPAVAAEPGAAGTFLVAAARLVQLDRLAGREPADDELVQKALAWWGEQPLPDDEFPPELNDDVRRLGVAAGACSGTVSWRVLGPLAPGQSLAVGGRRVDLTGEGSVRVPCGAWPVRRLEAGGGAGAWEGRVEVAAGATVDLPLSPRFEHALRLLSERSLEVRAYSELRDDLDELARAHPVRALEIVQGPDDQPDVRDPNEGPTTLPRATAVTLDAAAPRPSGPSTWGPWALYGLSAAALVAAVTLNVVTNGWIDDQNAGAGARFDRIEQGRVGAWTCYGIAGATALAGAAWQISTW